MASLKNKEPPQIDPNAIQVGEIIGEGCFGTVHVGRCRATDVAIKIPKKQDMTPDELEAFRKEVEIMSNIYAPNINLFMGASTVPGKIMIVTELLEGDLEHLLRNHENQVTLFERLKMARDAAQGVAWLHGSNPIIIHRDLKTSNLLFDKNKKIKVCDFGFSQVFPKGKKMIDEEGAKGTPLYMAPEVMVGDEFNEKADVYSFGIILWEVLTRMEPFSNHSDFDVFVEAVCMQNERPPLPKDCLPSLRKLITSCWAGNPSLRPSFPTIVDALENILIECAIEDEVARSIWKNYFFRKENVSWVDEFVPIVAQFMGTRFTDPAKNEQAYYDEIDRLITTLEWQCLQKILPEKKDSQDLSVNLEKFGQVLHWFGPFKDKDGKSRILENIKNTLSKPWFFGNVSYEGALEYLSDKNPGTFIIRFSSKENPGCFTISKVNQKKKIVHQRIMHRAGSDFSLNEKSFPTLDALVKHGDFKLETPCPGSPFAFLFVDKEVKNTTGLGLYGDPDDDD